MIVDNLDNPDRGDTVEVNASVVPAGNRIVIGCKDEPVGMYEIHRVLHFSPALQLVESFGAAHGYVGECPRILKKQEPHHDSSSLPVAVLFLKGGFRVEMACELFAFEGDYHRYAEGNDFGEGMSRRD